MAPRPAFQAPKAARHAYTTKTEARLHLQRAWGVVVSYSVNQLRPRPRKPRVKLQPELVGDWTKTPIVATLGRLSIVAVPHFLHALPVAPHPASNPI